MRKTERDAEYKQKVLAGLTPLQTPPTDQLAHEEALTRQGGSSEPTPPPVDTIITAGDSQPSRYMSCAHRTDECG